jgi:hypothetical protein
VASRKKRDPSCSWELPEIVRNRRLLANAVFRERKNKASRQMTAAYRGHMKVSIFVFILTVLAAGSVGAHENGASSARSEAVSITDQADRIFERAIDERTIGRLGLFDRSEDNSSGRYGVSLDLENEDSDWNFEVSVTLEF